MARAMAHPRLQLSLQFGCPRHRELLPRRRVARWIREALTRPAELTVRIVDETEGRQLNQAFRDQDHATNVLTFDYESEPLVVADVVLCADVIEREARAQGRALVAHYAHLLVHGALHAQGLDHLTPRQAKEMQQRESEILLSLGFDDPWRESNQHLSKKRPGQGRGVKASTLSRR